MHEACGAAGAARGAVRWPLQARADEANHQILELATGARAPPARHAEPLEAGIASGRPGGAPCGAGEPRRHVAAPASARPPRQREPAGAGSGPPSRGAPAFSPNYFGLRASGGRGAAVGPRWGRRDGAPERLLCGRVGAAAGAAGCRWGRRVAAKSQGALRADRALSTAGQPGWAGHRRRAKAPPRGLRRADWACCAGLRESRLASAGRRAALLRAGERPGAACQRQAQGSARPAPPAAPAQQAAQAGPSGRVSTSSAGACCAYGPPPPPHWAAAPCRPARRRCRGCCSPLPPAGRPRAGGAATGPATAEPRHRQ
jgi:hypothetical protein